MFGISARAVCNAICGIICLTILTLVVLQAQFLIHIITEDWPPHTSAVPASEPPQNYYTLLNITVSATERDIKRAYRKQVLLIHPDKLQRLETSIRKEGKRQFDAVTQAFEVLTSDRRCYYDYNVMKVNMGQYIRCLDLWHERLMEEREREAAVKQKQEQEVDEDEDEDREGYNGI
ncbi:hypothetical protein RRF57_010261 [Xylaria bambusicola]|uniref:J domain-containing protein n=1 Tax=Xylaria bambusicola TaxID=326684 RepID=A0AAN7UWD4_9PEZI